ncbi:MAG: nitroreductase family deazaflavin-dependent oxidoreductase [Caulobacteraceae bacterium]|nr:nitroreductase family deazaflavin-dependent oxidoreductase [Caulobacteraceae bacterium]
MKIKAGDPGWQETHLAAYLKTDGAEGRIVDFSAAGGSTETPCLVLRTKGRRSGEAKLLPLIYGEDGGDYVIVASKGGAPKDPAWYLNLEADPHVGFQVGGEKFDGHAKVVEGAERDRLYEMMSKIYPPYIAYQAKTERKIPVVRLHPQSRIEKL